MKLHYREYGTYSEEAPSLLLLHGLLGSSVNWHGIARTLEAENHLLVPDLRNHGNSPHLDQMSYPEMAQDLVRFLDDQGLESVRIIGHSMGGKVAMWLALTQPELVHDLVVVDIAPITYRNRFGSIFSALSELELADLESRTEADRHLARSINDTELRQYLLQNLTGRRGDWSWRINLKVLCQEMEQIIAFPGSGGEDPYPGRTLFIYGGRSDYVSAEHESIIRRLFPYARMRLIAGAGHWVYAEQPAAFLAALDAFHS